MVCGLIYLQSFQTLFSLAENIFVIKSKIFKKSTEIYIYYIFVS